MLDGTEKNYAPPVFEPEEGWEAIEDLSVIGGWRAFIKSDENAHVLRLCYFRRKRDGALVGKVWFGPGAEGPPHHTHGGGIAGVFDEIMGAAAWLAGYPILAARVTVDFRRPLPLGEEALYEAWVEEVDGRRIKAKSRIHSTKGLVYADASGIFVLIEPERLGNMKERVMKVVEKAGLSFPKNGKAGSRKKSETPE